jgi:signal recognition particle subunit SRP54
MHRQMADMMKMMGKGGRMPMMPGMGGGMPGGLPPGMLPRR